MSTMRDVAQMAGVSTATVSYVVNGGPRPVAAETQARVLLAMQTLGYKPNKLAQGLARKKTQAVAIIAPNNSDSFFAQLAQSVEAVAYDAGFNLILCNSMQSLERELDYFDLLADKHIDGILLTTCGIAGSDLRQVMARDIPLVILDREIAGVALDTVIFDNRAAGYQATEHMIEHGHRAIGFLAGPQALIGAMKRMQGYRECLLAHGIKPQEEWIGWADYTFDGGYRAMRSILAGDTRPTAVIASNDEMGVAVIHAVTRAWAARPMRRGRDRHGRLLPGTGGAAPAYHHPYGHR